MMHMLGKQGCELINSVEISVFWTCWYKKHTLLVSGSAAIPEACSEVVAAGHEARVGGWVYDTAHNIIVA